MIAPTPHERHAAEKARAETWFAASRALDDAIRKAPPHLDDETLAHLDGLVTLFHANGLLAFARLTPGSEEVAA